MQKGLTLKISCKLSKSYVLPMDLANPHHIQYPRLALTLQIVAPSSKTTSKHPENRAENSKFEFKATYKLPKNYILITKTAPNTT